jgi:hypothetical protein
VINLLVSSKMSNNKYFLFFIIIFFQIDSLVSFGNNCVIFFMCKNNKQIGDPLVQLPNGLIVGREATTFANKSYFAFEKIPYATPPLGPLRFKVFCHFEYVWRIKWYFRHPNRLKTGTALSTLLI